MRNIINLLTENNTADWILENAKSEPGKRIVLSSRQRGKNTFILTESLSDAFINAKESVIITRMIMEKGAMFSRLVEYTQMLKEEFPTLNIQISSSNHRVLINNTPIQIIAIPNLRMLDLEMRGRRIDNVYISEPDRYMSDELREITRRCEMCQCHNEKSNITLVGTRMKPWATSIYNAVPLTYKKIFVDQEEAFLDIRTFDISTDAFNREFLNI